MAIINGTDNPETLVGTAGDDTITGGRGNDSALMGAGNDRFIWNPGDGSDSVNGQTGFDTLEFNGANVAEHIDIFGDGAVAKFTRDVAGIVMDTVNVERIEFKALGGTDQITINDLTHTAVREVAIDLGGSAGGGDGEADNVIDNGTAGNDKIQLSMENGIVSINSLHEQVTLANLEFHDGLTVHGLGGNDIIDAAGIASGAAQITLDGGAGDDKITGTQGADFILGGDGNDTVIGGQGADFAVLGDGDDRFVWNPGDGGDTVEGQAGFDTLQFFGSNVVENMNVFANGGRAELTRDVGSITMDLNGVERIEIHAVGGADKIFVNDLSGTSVQQVAVDLAAAAGSTKPDADIDTVTVLGTQATDTITIASAPREVVVSGLAATVFVDHGDKNDILSINTLGGDDTIDASKLAANQMQLQINAGDGNDLVIGSAGDDLINGNRGNDTILAGAGNDRFTWNPGDGSDTILGEGGFDTLQFNGANINEKFNILADGSQVLMTRDVAAVTMDLLGVERIELKTLGGTDQITIGDLSGTDVKQIAIDLGGNGASNTGDGAADSIVANGGNANHHVTLSDSGGVVTVTGLPETLTVANADTGDNLTVNTGTGNDTIDASALHAGPLALTINSGAGNDVIFGSGGADMIFAGDGNDTVKWQPGGGSDKIDGGAGIDTLDLVGTTGDDTFQIFANGTGISVLGSDGSTVDAIGMEQINLEAGAGKDAIVIGDLTGTGIGNVHVDLGAGSKSDAVDVLAAPGEVMVITSKGDQTLISNAQTFQTITLEHTDASDVLSVHSAPGNVPGQVIEASTLNMSLHFTGGAGADTIFSGSGDDFIDGNQGSDTAFMGDGNDTFNWDPGDGSDTVDGQAGFDTLRFNGSNIGEQIDILADGSHAELTRNVAAITMHLNSVERIEVNAIGGADNIHVHDMTGTGVQQVAIDLAGFGGTPDDVTDIVTVDGTQGNDHITVSSAAGVVSIVGLPADVTVSHGETKDIIAINAGDGNDTINAAGVEDGSSKLTIDGGNGDDTITGGHGSDLIFGSDGHDILKGNEGNDTLDGGSQDDVLTGGQGDDTLIGGDGADTFNYTGTLDGHDVIADFSGSQGDRLNLTKLFDGLGVDAGDREGRVSIVDNHDGTVSVSVDADGNKGNGFELNVATLHTVDPVTIGHEVAVNG
jgi:Ca2+-binding RTX toxin-like protein